MLSCRDIDICRDSRTFGKSLGKKVLFWGSKTVFLEREVHYNMVYIAYHTHLTKNFVAIFALAKRLPTFATPCLDGSVVPSAIFFCYQEDESKKIEQ